ncbi:CCA tRNA nucleotidyltransferase, mitochondrial [Fusarium oxysporum f. sp. cubense race 1]|uniref:CCA tRNA nucleotidyltransferase, mitochondrial n=1 Tax=Fusarium oxysporum f. sp. cubense (strain race 1) TaxID=1229664 RepID=N4TUQ4_FUSC1|nr:CCA tRNA nucleotidyltransferase, mitochondrial [Fusarium oxysporum f. sp. cubense race 1]
MSSSKRAPSQATTIDLLPAEELLRDLLLECRQQLATPELEVWITGGWVRDRLMGIPCSDLDIALSTMTGEASYQQRALDLGIEFKKFNGFHSTKKNLDKSKKLETAVGRIFGLDLDLVNLAQDPARDFWALMESEKQKDMLWAMVVYAPLAGPDTKGHKLAVDEAINALKGTRQLYKLIESSLGNLESIRSTMELVIGSTPSRGTIGMMIRKWGVFWGLQVLFSALGEIVYLKPRPESPAPSQGEIDKVLQRHEALLSFAQKQRLNSVSSIRPILDGNAIKKALGVKQGGKLLARAIEVLLEWQLDHKEADEAAAEAWLLSQRDKLGLPIAESK